MARVHVDSKAVKKLRSLPAVERVLRDEAASIAGRANRTLRRKQSYPDYDFGVSLNRDGYRAGVFTRSNHAKAHDREENTLIRVLGGGR
jgi:hypothetical protein